MFEVLEKCLETDYAKELVQVRGQTRGLTTCTVKNGVVEQFSTTQLQGVGIRVLADTKSWGFSSTNAVDADQVETTLKNAVTLAKAASPLKRQKIILEPVNTITETVSAPVKKPISAYAPEDLVEIPLQACSHAQNVGSIAEVKATFISMEDTKYFVSSEGTRIKQDATRVMLFVNVIAKQNGNLCPASENVGHTGGLEIFDETPPHVLGERVAEKAVRLLTAKAPPSGTFNVVISPNIMCNLTP